MAVSDRKLPLSEVIFVASYLTIISSTVVSSQFEILIRDDMESVSLVIKLQKGGVFFLSMPYMNFNRSGLKNLRWNIGYYTF